MGMVGLWVGRRMRRGRGDGGGEGVVGGGWRGATGLWATR